MFKTGNTLGIVTLLGWLLSFPGVAAVQSPAEHTRVAQRYQFQEAEKALKKGHITRFRRLAKSLQDYPLYPYLEYAALKRQLDTATPEKIQAFLQQYGDSPLAGRLHKNWLYSLARRGRWQLLADNFDSTVTEKRLLCHYAHALVKTGQSERAFAILRERLWLTHRSLPRQCNKPIAAWKKSGELTPELVWQRIRLAMQKGRVRLARHLAKLLPQNERFWVDIWVKVRRDPGYLTEVFAHFSESPNPVLGWISVYGLRRMASKKPLEAAATWKTLKRQYPFSSNEAERIERRLALALLNEHDDKAAQLWLAELDLGRTDDKVISLHFFSAMQDQDWETALAWLERLSPAQQHTEQWRYWRGRVLEAMGRLEEARSVYVLNGESRGYYSFLAADRAGHRYQFAHVPLRYEASDLADLSALPSIQRARELIAIKRTVDARREWNYTIARLPQAQLLKAAKLADQWGWHDRVIATLAQAGYWDDLELRFPLGHQQLVLSQAARQKINPAWAFAIIRQESAFTPDARSHAGALGLMQLLPRTARRVARNMHLRRPKRHDLLKAETNIRLGLRFLKKVQDRFHGHPVLATAAYNAGQYRVKQWLPQQGSVAADVWIETVPFKETREYLKRVLTYTVIYEQRLGRQPVPLLERMTPIGVSIHTADKTLHAGHKDT